MNRLSSISIPNILTVVRILLTPLFLILLQRHDFALALAIFVAAGLSDGLDGFIARYFNQRTALGAYLDPMADKLLLVSSFVALSVIGVIPGWVAIVVIARDVIILLGIAIFALTQKSYEVRPTIVSKFTTAAQILLIITALFDPSRVKLIYLHPLLLWIAAVLTILSGLHYIYIGLNILQDSSTTP